MIDQDWLAKIRALQAEQIVLDEKAKELSAFWYNIKPVSGPKKFVAPGHYRMSTEGFFSNIQRGCTYSGEMSSKWYADLRREDGSLVHQLGIYNSKAEAAADAKYYLERA